MENKENKTCIMFCKKCNKEIENDYPLCHDCFLKWDSVRNDEKLRKQFWCEEFPKKCLLSWD